MWDPTDVQNRGGVLRRRRRLLLAGELTSRATFQGLHQ